MRKIALVFALFPSLALAAAATWAPVSTTALCDYPGRGWSNSNCRSVVATCAAGACDAPSAATDGINLSTVGTVGIQVCATTAGQTITGGTITLYYYDAAAGIPVWAPSSQTFTLKTGSRCAEVIGDSPGRGIPMLLPRGRMAPKLDATVSSGGVTMTVLATGYANQAL